MDMTFTEATPAARARRIAAAALLCAAALCASAAPAAAATIAGQWRFDEGAGETAQDDGPFGLHGVLGAAAQPDLDDPLRIPGALGGALRFDDNSYVRIQDRRRLDLPELTVEAVARADGSPGSYRYLVAHGSVGCFAGSYGLYTARDGGVAFYVFDGERYFVSATARPADVWDGAWHRVTGSFDGATVRVFVDGREVGTGLRTPAGTTVEYDSVPEGTYFGTFVGACRLPFTGDLDSVRIWSAEEEPAAPAGLPGGTADAPLEPAAAATVVAAPPPKASCAVLASRKRIRPKRRVRVTVRAASTRGPLRRVRLAVRRTGARKVIASSRTNTKGSARLVLKVQRSGRLRISVAGLDLCAPAFIRVAKR
jgi:Concanavalin A-like lectin/glucanases superfamily